jgi:predicted RNA-binding Zn ribbon-like protein
VYEHDLSLLRFLNDGHVDGNPTPAEARRLARLRALLHELAATVGAGTVLSEDQLVRINDVIGRRPVRAQLESAEAGGYLVDFTPVGGDWIDRVERDLAGAFVSMLRRAHPPRIKVCPGCGAVFYDESKNRTRRWCDPRSCGNRERVRRYRRRTSRS